MRKIFLAVAVAMTVPAGAALATQPNQLHPPHIGASCGKGEIGIFHLVNNQVTGDPTTTTPAIVTMIGGVVKSTSNGGCLVKHANNQNAQFICTGTGAITYAASNLGGKIVLSDLDCDKKPEPPK